MNLRRVFDKAYLKFSAKSEIIVAIRRIKSTIALVWDSDIGLSIGKTITINTKESLMTITEAEAILIDYWN